LISICRLLFGMNMFLTFPIECFVCREVLYEVLYADKFHPSIDINKVTSNLVHVSITCSLVLSAMLIALSTCDLGFVLELTVMVINSGWICSNSSCVYLACRLIHTIGSRPSNFSQKNWSFVDCCLWVSGHGSIYVALGYEIHFQSRECEMLIIKYCLHNAIFRCME
jgi:hypothetical protein